MTRAQYQAQWNKSWRAKRRAQGGCTRCSEPAIPGMVLCVRHKVSVLMRHGTDECNSTKWTRYLAAIKQGTVRV